MDTCVEMAGVYCWGHRGPCTHRQALGKPEMSNRQGCLFKGRDVLPVSCLRGWEWMWLIDQMISVLAVRQGYICFSQAPIAELEVVDSLSNPCVTCLTKTTVDLPLGL